MPEEMIIRGGGKVIGANEEIVEGPEFFDGVDGGNLFDGGFVGVDGGGGFFFFSVGVFGDAFSAAHVPECEGCLEFGFVFLDGL